MTAEPIAATALPAAGRYRIHPERSKVSYTGRHMMGLGVVHATFDIKSGEIHVADPTTASTVTVLIDAGSFASGNAKRDRDIRSAPLLNTDSFPDITFASDDLCWDGGHWLLSGTVTAHGVAVPTEVTFERVVHEPPGIRVLARARHLDRYAFGVTGSKGWVGRHLDLDLDVYAALDD